MGGRFETVLSGAIFSRRRKLSPDPVSRVTRNVRAKSAPTAYSARASAIRTIHWTF